MNHIYKNLKINRLAVILGLLLAVFGETRAQHINYQNDSGWKFGFNGGGVWQQSDMQSKAGIGFGATLGKALYQKPGRYFAFDLRFRYLHAYNFGYTDTAITQFPANSIYSGNNTNNPLLNAYQSQGKMFYNYRMSLNEYTMEGVLTFNRLRERTGIVLYTWGGIGITTYRVKTDQLQDDFFSSTPYNYTTFDSTATWGELSNLWDGSYETDADMNNGLQVGIMPSWGLGFGYQFSPYFAMVLEHKITFALNDRIDGFAFQNPEGPVNDRYHYTGLKFVFHFGRGNGHVHTNYNYNTTTTTTTTATTSTSTVVTTPQRQRPIINITQPSMSPTTVFNQYYTVNANIYNIDGASNITYKVNGTVSNNFTFNSSTNQFTSSILLNPGSNMVEIRATNEVGSDYQSVIIVFDMPVVNTTPPPIVTFTNPPFTPFNTNNNTYNITATVLNVLNSSGIQFRVNGQLISGFSFNPTSKAFSAVIGLNPGPNTVEIKATNTAGFDIKQVTLNYQPVVVQLPPVVTITNPTLNPYTVNVNSATVEATVLNVNHSSDIRLRINGQLSPNFTYNTTTKVMNIIASLIPGANTFEITATNSVGTDTKTTTIVYVQPSALPPLVTFIDPAINPTTVNTSTKVVKATVQNVVGQNNIQVRLNGNLIPNFSWNAGTKTVQFTANLNPGANTVQITATNTVGSDIKATTIVFQQVQTGQPPIVTISNPAQNPHSTTSPNASIIGSVLNVGGASQITFKVNGTPSTNFSYNSLTKAFLANVTLNPGTNVFEISATNAYGNDSKTQTINYTLPCLSPVITLVQPATANFQTSISNLPFTAIVQNISGQGALSFKLNGNPYPFTYNAANGTVSATLNLTGTSNTVELKATNNCGVATQSILIYYQAPLVPPVVTITNPATNPFTSASSTTTINATIQHVNSASNVQFKVNGNPVTGFAFNPQTTQFSANVNLIAGANTIEITGTNNDGSDSKSTVVLYQPVAPPCQQPVIVLTQPAGNHYSTANSSLSVTANILNVSSASGIVFKLNGTVVPFTFNAANGSFTGNVNFTQANNTIEIIATNSCGSSTNSIHITYNRPLVPPVVTILNPGQNPFTSTVPTFTLTAKILNILGASNVTFTVNGTNNTNFTYDPNTQIFTSNVTLATGNNVFTISATNADGSDSQSTTIIYQPVVAPCNVPVITPVAPATGSETVVLANYTIQASVLNATQNQISFKQNGVSKTFSYNTTTQLLNAAVTLADGTNTFEITATNNCGAETISFSITYNRPLVPPTVTITQPAANPYTSATASTTINATVLHVSGTSNITYKVNGVPSTSFTYNTTTKVFSSTVNLNPGNNTVEITATNNDGTASDSRTIVYQYVAPCNPPSISITSPGQNTTVSVPVSTLSATVINVSNQSAITVKLNGSTIPFTYNAGQLGASLNLVEGANVVEISAGSNCGNTSESVTITYNRPLTPPTVTITSPQNGSTTQTSSTNVVATVTNISSASGISFLVNGNPSTSFNFNAATNSFTASVNLTPGLNTFAITATNQDGQASDQTSITYQPCVAPQIILSQPSSSSGTTVANSAYQFSAMVQNGSNTTTTVTLNGAAVNATTNGSTINANLNLVAGNNTVVVSVNGPCGNATETVAINFTPCYEPEITLTQINANGTTVTSSSFAIGGTISNSSGVTVSASVNGTNFNLNNNNGTFSGALTLTPGSNTIVVHAAGPCGDDSKTIVVTYQPCQQPVVSINSSASATSNADYALSGTVANHNNTTLSVTHNGTAINAAYNGGSFSADIDLVSGTNTIVVTANGACGNATQTISVTYTPCNAPSITLAQNNFGGATTTTATHTLTGTVSHHNGTTVNVTQNGNTVPSTYSNGNISAAITLAPGSNTFVVTVSGPCGTDTKGITVSYNPCTNPVINMTNPSSANITVNDPNFNVLGSVTGGLNNVISVNLNAQEVFLTSTTNTINTNVTLQQGANTIQVNVRGECGLAQANFVVNYTPQVVTPPCNPVSFTKVSPAQASTSVTTASYAIQLTVQNVQSSGVDVTVNGSSVPFTLNGTTLSISNINLNNGSNNVVVNLTNPCSNETVNYTITYTPAACGPRFNPGNSQWEFCLITPSGTFTRDNLAANPNFSYSGPASSAYFKPIAGGGDAVVNGSPYPVQNGNYYHFSGNLNVNVSSNHPGSMGHWTICIESNSVPVFGNGNNRPASPCQATNTNQGGGNNNQGGGNGNGNDNRNMEQGGQDNRGGNQNKTAEPNETDRAYQEAVSAGDKAFAEQRYFVAKQNYEKAKNLKPNEQYPKTKIAECDQLIDRKRAEDEVQRQAQQEAQRKAQEEAQRKAQQEAQQKAQQDAQRKAQEDAQRKAQQEAQQKAQQEAQRKAQDDAAKKAAAEAAAKKKQEEEAKKKAEEEKKKQEEQKKVAPGGVRPGGKVGVTINEEGGKK